MTELWIVQPYVPRYRVPFFERLFASLDNDGITARVVASTPEGAQAARGDAATPPWLTLVPPRTIAIAGVSLVLTSTRSRWARADGVIVPHMGTSLDAYSALLGPRRRKRRVGLWGHIKSYVAPPNPIDARLETWQMRHADQIFAYTPGGAAHAVEAGVLPDRVTTVMNAVDTGPLAVALASLSTANVDQFLGDRDFTREKTFAFIGGLDESKRIDFLAEALEVLWVESPDIRLLVGGQGSQQALLAPAIARGQVVTFGYVDTEKKALLLRASRGLLSPGRIGLIAVEALAAGLPILSTRWPYHAPESEYLEESTSLLLADDSAREFANLMSDVASRPIRPLVSTHSVPSIDDMVHRYREGVLRMLS